MGFNENKKPTTSKGVIRTGLARSFIGDRRISSWVCPDALGAAGRARKLSSSRTFIIVDRNICDIYFENLGYMAVFGECKSGGPSRVGSLKELESESWMEIGQLSG